MSGEKGRLEPAMQLAAHIFWRTVIFSIIAWAAFVLRLSIRYMQASGAPDGFIMMLDYVELLMFLVDIFSYIVMIVGAACIFARQMLREVRES